jgi:hypothetical protein
MKLTRFCNGAGRCGFFTTGATGKERRASQVSCRSFLVEYKGVYRIVPFVSIVLSLEYFVVIIKDCPIIEPLQGSGTGYSLLLQL